MLLDHMIGRREDVFLAYPLMSADLVIEVKRIVNSKGKSGDILLQLQAHGGRAFPSHLGR
jgi:hypothetical protein